jgi:hypothetical protein
MEQTEQEEKRIISEGSEWSSFSDMRGTGEKIFVERIVGDSGGYHYISHSGTEHTARKEI